MSTDKKPVRSVPKTISMYPSDWKIVQDADIGNAGISATLRRIISEWQRGGMGSNETT